MTRSKILGTLFVPVIALTVFANQLYRQAAYDLSAWKGGGMGMFASADAPAYRFARVIAETDGGPVYLDCYSSDLERRLTSATHEPSERNLAALAEAVLAKTWHRHEAGSMSRSAPATAGTMRLRRPAGPSFCPYPAPGGLGDESLRFESVRVIFYKLAYDRDTNTLSAVEEAALDHVRPGRS